jgi:hypothetical protein
VTKEQIHEAIDRLNPDQLSHVQSVLEQLSGDDPRERWKGISGLRVPAVWPPDYGDFRAVRLTGESVADQLIRERR